MYVKIFNPEHVEGKVAVCDVINDITVLLIEE